MASPPRLGRVFPPLLLAATAALAAGPPPDVLWTPPADGAWLGGYRSRTPWTSWTEFVHDHEAMIGRPLDVLRHFRRMLSGHLALDAQMLAFIEDDRRLLVNWKPGGAGQEQWGNSAGVASEHCADESICQVVDDNLRQLADSIAAIAPRRIMLTLWHEPENEVDGHVCAPPDCRGTEEEYVAMWSNTRAIFEERGADNVIWAWTMTGYSGHFALLPDLWPGNELVDWVLWDPYLQGTGGTDIVAKIDVAYEYFLTAGDADHDWASKPWGLAEWGTALAPNQATPEEQAAAFAQLEAALNDEGAFPRLKLLAYFDAGASEIQVEPAVSAYRSLARSGHLSRLFADGFESGDVSAWSVVSAP